MRPKSILVIGGSAGGHLALWTGSVEELWLQATELSQSLVDIDFIRFE